MSDEGRNDEKRQKAIMETAAYAFFVGVFEGRGKACADYYLFINRSLECLNVSEVL